MIEKLLNVHNNYSPNKQTPLNKTVITSSSH